MNIYVDGSYCPITKKAGVGINISQDGITKGVTYSWGVETINSLHTELRAIEMAFIAFRFNKQVTIYTDCQVITKAFKDNRLIKGFEDMCLHLFNVLKECKFKLKWVKREKNIIADGLARKARKS